ncbi:uncharacterized protein [Montipora foliosa]|uniref:uncharacterized protein n=1 Tax=Montipora foliosa TaxID=591990 RepID=UPI0035F11F4D
MQDVYYTFPEAREPGEGESVYTVAMEQLDQYFKSNVNVPYERHLFRTMTQLLTESVDQFITRLRERAEYCEFGDAKDENIRDQVIEKCMSRRLRRKLLEKGRELTLEQLQNTARSMEASDRQAGAFQNPNDKEGLKKGLNSIQEKTEGKRCYRCDATGHTEDDKRCPARDKECRKCHKIGSEDSPDSEYAFTVVDGKQPMVQVNVGGVPNVAMMVDSGASCNVIGRKLWEELKQNKVKCVSMKSNKKLYPYGSAEPFKTAGCFVATVTVPNVTVEAEFTIIEGKGQALLGRETATQLNVLCLGEEVRVNVLKEEDIFDKYKSCFEGLAKLKDFQLDIPIYQNVKPVAQPMRRLPFSIRDKLEQKLNELVDLDVIERAEGLTPWISPVVVVPKPNGNIRLCVDMRQANGAIVRERHPIPTVDEVLHDLNGSTVFSKLDIKWN